MRFSLLSFLCCRWNVFSSHFPMAKNEKKGQTLFVICKKCAQILNQTKENHSIINSPISQTNRKATKFWLERELYSMCSFNFIWWPLQCILYIVHCTCIRKIKPKMFDRKLNNSSEKDEQTKKENTPSYSSSVHLKITFSQFELWVRAPLTISI